MGTMRWGQTNYYYPEIYEMGTDKLLLSRNPKLNRFQAKRRSCFRYFFREFVRRLVALVATSAKLLLATAKCDPARVCAYRDHPNSRQYRAPARALDSPTPRRR